MVCRCVGMPLVGIRPPFLTNDTVPAALANVSTVLAATEEGEGVSFDSKICLVANGGKLSFGQTDVHLFDAVAARAGEVMMVAISTDAVVMGAVGELNTIQQPHADQLLDRAVDCGASQAWLLRAHVLPQVVNCEISATLRQGYQAFRNKPSRAGITLAYFIKRCINFLC